jgi:hypothetical protein
MDKLIRNYDFRLLKVSLPYLKTSDAHHGRDVTAANIPGQKYSFVFENVASKMLWKRVYHEKIISHPNTIFHKLFSCVCLIM